MAIAFESYLSSIFNDQDISATTDVREFYNNTIAFIDSYRSYFNIVSSSVFDEISQENINKIFADKQIETSYQESRVNCFYRLLGLPVISPDDNTIYTPGVCISLNTNSDYQASKASIANSIIKSNASNLRYTFDFRETRQSFLENIFAKQDVNATLLALAISSVRKFDYYDQLLGSYSVTDQSYKVESRNQLQEVLKDQDGNVSDISLDNQLNNHILFPFMQDPRIEFTVSPASKRIAAPFLLNDIDRKIQSDTYLNKPYIEQVITLRCNSVNLSNSNNYTQTIINYVLNDQTYNDPDVMKVLSEINKPSLIDVLVVKKLYKILKSLVRQLAKSVIEFGEILQSVNFYCIPSKTGPEGGVKLRDALNTLDSLDKNIEKSIRDEKIKRSLEEGLFVNYTDLISSTTSTFTDLNQMLFQQFHNVTSSSDRVISNLNSKREHYSNSLSEVLFNIEALTGEISGLGIIDIICTMIALWSVDKKYLINMLDDITFNRLNGVNKSNVKVYQKINDETVKERQTAGQRTAEPAAVLLAFEAKIVEAQAIAQKMYIASFEENS